MQIKDYSLLGPDAERAVDAGLASADWYRTNLSRQELKSLVRRSDGPAIRDTILWLGSMIVFAIAAIYCWPDAWYISIAFLLAYGVLYGSASDSRWHECGHGTAFKTQWMNETVYQIASFMIMRNPERWRWSHARHHTDTIIVGRDPEIVAMRPPPIAIVSINFFGILDAWQALGIMLRNAAGILDEADCTFVPVSERHKVYRVARIWCVMYVLVIVFALAFETFWPLVLIGLPRLYGAWHHVMTGVLQHAGLAEDVLDHRLNTRTIHMNPISRFIYWNMNYHIEHHMFPMVPFYALPRLHEHIRHDLPTPYRSILAAYRDLWPILKRQREIPTATLERELPHTATPYKHGS